MKNFVIVASVSRGNGFCKMYLDQTEQWFLMITQTLPDVRMQYHGITAILRADKEPHHKSTAIGHWTDSIMLHSRVDKKWCNIVRQDISFASAQCAWEEVDIYFKYSRSNSNDRRDDTTITVSGWDRWPEGGSHHRLLNWGGAKGRGGRWRPLHPA